MVWHYDINQGATRGQSLRVGNSITYTSVEIDFEYHGLGVNYQSVIDDNVASEGFFFIGTSSVAAGGWSARTVNGTAINSGGANPVQDTKITLKLTRSTATVSASGANFVIGDAAGGGKPLQAKFYAVRFYSGATLVANFDLTNAGTFTDQTGNGNTLTAVGGSWVNDGGDPGTDVSYTYAMRQTIHADRTAQAPMAQAIYADRSAQAATLQKVYADRQYSNPTNQAVYADRSAEFPTRQAIYAERSWAFPMLQQIFSDYVLFSSSFPLKQIIYADRSIPFATRQEIWTDRQYVFATTQRFFDPSVTIVGRIQLEGQRELYVYLVGQRELEINLKGGLN